MKEKMRIAKELGREAFHNGVMCAPVRDAKLMNIVEEMSKDGVSCIKVLKAWLAGWHGENIKAAW